MNDYTFTEIPLKGAVTSAGQVCFTFTRLTADIGSCSWFNPTKQLWDQTGCTETKIDSLNVNCCCPPQHSYALA